MCAMKNWLVSLPLVLLLAFLLGYLSYLAWRSWKRLDELELKDRFAARNDFIKTAAQILGGAFFLITIYFTYQNLLVAEKNLAETQEKNKADLSIARDKQTTELYVKAIEQLGSDKLEVRLGGIYALERIARESEKDYWPIMEVLTACVRKDAPWPLKSPSKTTKKSILEIRPTTNVQNILTVIGRSSGAYVQGEDHRVDLSATDLRGVNLNKANLQWAVIRGSCLINAKLWEAHLENANLREAILKHEELFDAHLEKADLSDVRMQNAILENVNLNGAILTNAYLNNAFLYHAKMEGANLDNAQMEGANLKGVDLRGANGLTRKQLAGALNVDENMLPDYLKKPKPEKSESK